jgi:hypothetical protein
MVNAIPHLVRIVDESAPAAGKGAQKSKKD